MELTPSPKARIVPIGEPVEGGITLFSGSISDARQTAERMSADEREAASVWTDGNMRTVDEFLAETG